MKRARLCNGHLRITKDRDVTCWRSLEAGVDAVALCSVDCAAFRIGEVLLHVRTSKKTRERLVFCLALPREYDGSPAAIAELAETVEP